MICRVGRRRWTGRAIDLPVALDPEALAASVRGELVRVDGRDVAVYAPRPHPIHERVGCVHPGLSVRVRTALAGAARARGLTGPHRERIDDLRRELATAAAPVPDVPSVESGVSDEELTARKEAVAAARGRLAVHREHDVDPEAATDRLERAVGALADAETERIGAHQRRERARRAARERRDELQERMELRDELENLRRRNRAALVERVRSAYESALAALPGREVPRDPFAVDGPAAALAIARVANLSAPVVLSGDRFDGARPAASYLGTPVVRLGV